MNSRENHRSRNVFVTLALTLAMLFGFAAFYAPKYLAYADNPVKADAVVLFIGPDFKAREKEAQRLIEEGYADYLFVPTAGISGKGSSAFVGKRGLRDKLAMISKSVLGDSPAGPEAQSHMEKPFFERTHLEILEAKRMMAEYGFKSALFVSSPYHMRRIKIITENVFNGDGQYILAFVPTSFEKLPANLLDLCRYAYRSIMQEYFKIAVFLVYSKS